MCKYKISIRPDELHDGKDLPVDATLLLLLQHQHEEKAEAGLHHHPQDDGQEHNVLPLVEWHCPVFQY